METNCHDALWLPEFLGDDECPFNNEYNFEWKRYLLKKNSEEINAWSTSRERFTFYRPKIVKCVFNICKMLQQPPEVRYLAVDVLDRFLVEHFFKVREAFEEMDEKNVNNWETIIDRILNQSLLRILTCIQLAMKFSWSCNVLTAETIQEIMKKLGQGDQYSKKSILKSEARVYKNLNYNIPSKTPLIYLEMFFDDFQKHKYFHMKIPLHRLFITCIHVLDVAFVYHQQIYSNFFEFLKSSSSNSDNRIAALKADFVVLAASVVFASSVLEDPSTSTSKSILGILCAIGECEIVQIQALANQLLNIIFYD